MKIAGIDVHKKVLMIVIVDGSAPEEKPTRRRFATFNCSSAFRNWVDGTVAAVDVRTRRGNIPAQIYPGSNMNSGWEVRTDDGDVDLRLPEDFSADLDVSAGDGNVRLDFPIAMIGGGRQSSIRGPINGGGQHLELHSGKGNIVVRKPWRVICQSQSESVDVGLGQIEPDNSEQRW